MSKEDLIKILLHEPLRFDRENLMDELLKTEMKLSFDDIRYCIRKIYNLTESQLEKTSNANEGIMGFLNRKSTARRKKKFNRRIKKIKDTANRKIIYAEGDSWFQFPLFIRDIIDWLNRFNQKRNIIYSDAYGGDWITNIIYESQYVPALSVLRPDFFLISGGGNDLVGNNRLAIMVRRENDPVEPCEKYTAIDQINDPDPDLDEKHKQMIVDAQKYITKEFYAFLLTIKAQYILLFRSIYHPDSPHKNMISITQGYDYAIPGMRPKWRILHLFQVFVNFLVDNGGWLKRPLNIRGIFCPEIQKLIVTAFIYEFNLIFISLARNFGFDNLYHIDCRGLADKQPRSWYDELHYRSRVFKKVAEAYQSIIDGNLPVNKVKKV